MYTTFASRKANNAELILALKLRGDITRNKKIWVPVAPKRTCGCVSQKKKVLTDSNANDMKQRCRFYVSNRMAWPCSVCLASPLNTFVSLG